MLPSNSSSFFLIPGMEERTETTTIWDRDLHAPYCSGRHCSDAMEATPIGYQIAVLRVVELVMNVVTIVLNVLLVAAISFSPRQFETAFFKLIRILSTVLSAHAVASVALKIVPFLAKVSFAHQNDISLYIDLSTRYLGLLMVLILASNRYCVMAAPDINSVLFSRAGYWSLVCLASLSSAGLTVAVIELGDMRRHYVAGYGFVDSIAYPTLYRISGHCFLCVPLISLLLHAALYLRIRKSQEPRLKSPEVASAEKRMCVQVILIAAAELVFITLYEVLSALSAEGLDIFFIVSLYNSLSVIPELLMPAFVLFGTRGIARSVTRLFSLTGSVRVHLSKPSKASSWN
ncbi:hypothetical protein Q1695_016403 [Nippostrongylus brasiliensis]|nr:hypothetical protein Q1695_016403 [Nippostrongylus brasiliensis]